MWGMKKGGWRTEKRKGKEKSVEEVEATEMKTKNRKQRACKDLVKEEWS